MKKAITLSVIRKADTIFSEAASLPSGASAAARGATMAKRFRINHTADLLAGALFLIGAHASRWPGRRDNFFACTRSLKALFVVS